jgi:hypothetical protein
VAQYVDDDAVRIFDEKAANAPRLVGQGIDDLQVSLDRDGVDAIDIVDLNRHLRVNRS